MALLGWILSQAQQAGALATLIGTLVTAVATVLLWRVTRVLAVETARLARATSQPQVVVSIEPNTWALMYADIVVQNTGNATAFDINVSFDPPLEREESERNSPFPLQRVSVLRPGQKISNFLTAFSAILNQSYTVTVRWKRDPGVAVEESLSYVIDLSDFEGRGHLGAVTPQHQIAEAIKQIRDDWRPVATGSRRLSVDMFSSGDRLHQRRVIDRHRRQRMRAQVQTRVSEDPDQPEVDG